MIQVPYWSHWREAGQRVTTENIHERCISLHFLLLPTRQNTMSLANKLVLAAKQEYPLALPDNYGITQVNAVNPGSIALIRNSKFPCYHNIKLFKFVNKSVKCKQQFLPHLELLVNAGDNKEVRNAHSRQPKCKWSSTEQAQMRQLSTDWFHSLAHLLSPIFATGHMTVGVLPETFQPCLAAPTVTVHRQHELQGLSKMDERVWHCHLGSSDRVNLSAKTDCPWCLPCFFASTKSQLSFHENNDFPSIEK